jgi:hypothetical protein
MERTPIIRNGSQNDLRRIGMFREILIPYPESWIRELDSRLVALCGRSVVKARTASGGIA